MPAIRGSQSKKKTRRHTRDLDQVHADVASSAHLKRHLDNHHPEDLPAYGEHYCIPCAKWFSDETNFVNHAKGKPHKRRLRQLQDTPYSQREAEAAVGKFRQTRTGEVDLAALPSRQTDGHDDGDDGDDVAMVEAVVK